MFTLYIVFFSKVGIMNFSELLSFSVLVNISQPCGIIGTSYTEPIQRDRYGGLLSGQLDSSWIQTLAALVLLLVKKN